MTISVNKVLLLSSSPQSPQTAPTAHGKQLSHLFLARLISAAPRPSVSGARVSPRHSPLEIGDHLRIDLVQAGPVLGRLPIVVSSRFCHTKHYT